MWGVCDVCFDILGKVNFFHNGVSDEASAPRSFYVCLNLIQLTSAKVAKQDVIWYYMARKRFNVQKHLAEFKARCERRRLLSNIKFQEEIEQEIPVCNNFTISHNLPASIAIIYKSEFDYISRCILDCTNIETGGQLFGFWTAERVPVVLYAIGPGPNANHQGAFFNQDVDYLTRVGRPIVEHFGLQHIGEWHSHHQLGLAQPSTHDANTMISTIKDKHLGQFLLCIGNCTNTSSTLNAFNFSEFSQNYVKAQWCIKDIESPFRKPIDIELAPFLVHPRTEQANTETVYSTESQQNLPPEYKDSYWFSIKENRQILKQIMDALGQCSIQQDNSGYIYLIKNCGDSLDTIFFPEDFPQQTPRIKRRYSNNTISELNVPWSYNGDLLNDFINYYNQTIGM